MARSPEYKPEYCQMLIDHMKEGYSYESFAASIGTCRQTLYNWEKQFEEFLDTKRLAFEACQFWWEKQGKDGLFSQFQGSNLNPSLWIFNMKARFRWRDEVPQELPQIPERAVLTLEDKKKLLAQGEEELKKLRQELEKVNG